MVVPSYHLSIETPTPLVVGVGVMFAPVTCCVFCAFGSATQWECFVRRVLALRKTSSRPSGSVPSAPPTSPHAETSSGVSLPGASSSSSSLSLGGQGLREGSRGAPGVCLGGFLPSRSISVEREGWRCLWAVVWGALPLLLLLRERAKWGLPARCRLPFFRTSGFVVSPQFSPHVPRRENSRETA